MILGGHILPLDANTWLLVMVDAATDKVIYAYAFTTQQDAENAAALATGIYNAPATRDLTYDQLINELLRLTEALSKEPVLH